MPKFTLSMNVGGEAVTYEIDTAAMSNAAVIYLMSRGLREALNNAAAGDLKSGGRDAAVESMAAKYTELMSPAFTHVYGAGRGKSVDERTVCEREVLTSFLRSKGFKVSEVKSAINDCAFVAFNDLYVKPAMVKAGGDLDRLGEVATKNWQRLIEPAVEKMLKARKAVATEDLDLSV